MFRMLVMCTALVLAANTSFAATISTAFLNTTEGGKISCSLSNLSSDPVTARIVGLDGSGAVPFDTGEFTLAAGASAGINGPLNLIARCEFTADTSRRRLRGAARVINPAGEPEVVLPAF